MRLLTKIRRKLTFWPFYPCMRIEKRRYDNQLVNLNFKSVPAEEKNFWDAKFRSVCANFKDICSHTNKKQRNALKVFA